jgi:hypothetical protein
MRTMAAAGRLASEVAAGGRCLRMVLRHTSS